MPMTGRGRWYECVGGDGLEVELNRFAEFPDEERWVVAGHVQQEGKRRPQFIVRINRQEESYTASTHRTREEAKQALLEIFKVKEVVNS